MVETIMFGFVIGYAIVSAVVGLFVGTMITALFNGYGGLDIVIGSKDSVYLQRVLKVRAQFRSMNIVRRVLYTVLTFFVGFVVAAIVWPATVSGK